MRRMRSRKEFVLATITAVGLIAGNALPVFAGDPNNPESDNYQGYKTSQVSNQNEKNVLVEGNIPRDQDKPLRIGFGIIMTAPSGSQDHFWTSNWNGRSQRVWFDDDTGEFAGAGECYYASDLAKMAGAKDVCTGKLQRK